MENIKSRNIGVDLLKIILCYGIVLYHVTAFEGARIEVYNLPQPCVTTYFIYFIENLCRCCVPCFVMISGYFMIKKNHGISYIWKKSIPKLLLIKVASSLSLIFFAIISFAFNLSTWGVIELLSWDNMMWFIGMLICLYAFTPIIHSISKDEKLIKYTIVILFISVYLFPIVKNFNIAIVNREIDAMQFTFPKYLLFYLLGYYIWSYDKKVSKLGLTTLWFIGISWLLYVAIDNTMWTNPASWKSVTADVFILILTTTIFVTARQYLFNRHFTSSNLSKRIGDISVCTMLIYAFHNTVLQFFGRWGIYLHISTPYWIIISTTIIFIVCLIFAKITFFFIHIILNRLLILKKKTIV